MKLDRQTYLLRVSEERAICTKKTSDELADMLINLAERPSNFTRYEKEALLYVVAIRMRKAAAARQSG